MSGDVGMDKIISKAMVSNDLHGWIKLYPGYRLLLVRLVWIK